jgi:hypothetical protein
MLTLFRLVLRCVTLGRKRFQRIRPERFGPCRSGGKAGEIGQNSYFKHVFLLENRFEFRLANRVPLCEPESGV